MPERPACLPDPFEWVTIPGGEVHLQWPYGNVQSLVVQVEPFHMAKYPITNAQFAVYRSETGREPHSRQTLDNPLFNEPLQPASNLRWQEAMAFCEWLSQKAGYLITLPTDAQWQRAAQGDDERQYPWGNEWDSTRCNSTENNRQNATTPVTQYPQGASPFGVMDMIGNVWEWCLTDRHTGANSLDYDFPEDQMGKVMRIFKGGMSTSIKHMSIPLSGGATPIYYPYQTGIRLVNEA
jgi:formylglycine-generating enzyme required for sulfatase activity